MPTCPEGRAGGHRRRPPGRAPLQPLAAPVRVNAGGLYLLVSQEVDRDSWYSYDIAVATTGVAAVPGAAYGGSGGS